MARVSLIAEEKTFAGKSILWVSPIHPLQCSRSLGRVKSPEEGYRRGKKKDVPKMQPFWLRLQVSQLSECHFQPIGISPLEEKEKKILNQPWLKWMKPDLDKKKCRCSLVSLIADISFCPNFQPPLLGLLSLLESSWVLSLFSHPFSFQVTNGGGKMKSNRKNDIWGKRQANSSG